MVRSINPFWALEWDWFVCCHNEVERLFTYLLCSLMVSVNEQHKAILRTGFEVSTLSAADCSVFPGSKYLKKRKKVVQQQFILIYFLFQSGSWKNYRSVDKSPALWLRVPRCTSCLFSIFWRSILVTRWHLWSSGREKHHAYTKHIQVCYTACGISVSDNYNELFTAVCLSHLPVHQLSLW